MKIKKPYRGERIVITVTWEEKMAIAAQAERERRTVTSYIRYRLRDILEDVNDDRE